MLIPRLQPVSMSSTLATADGVKFDFALNYAIPEVLIAK